MSVISWIFGLILLWLIPAYLVVTKRSAAVIHKGVGLALVILFSWIGYLIFYLAMRSRLNAPN